MGSDGAAQTLGERTAAAVVEPGAVRGGVPLTLAFVGAFAQPHDTRDNPAYSPAGTLLQQNLLAGLAEAGVDVSGVYSLRPVPSFPARRRIWFGPGEQLVAGRFRAHLLPFVNAGALKIATSGLALLPALVRWAYRYRRRNRAILIYNVSAPPGAAAVLAGRLTRTPVYAVVADIQVPGQGFVADTWVRRLDFRLQTRTLPWCTGLIVLTRRMGVDYAPRTPALLMEGGVPDHAAQSPRARPVGVGGPVVFMYAGSLTELKGAALLRDAMAHAATPDIELWIAGSGPLEQELRDLQLRDPRVRVLGVLPYDRLLELYDKVDVFVNPHSSAHASARYLFPSKLLEYLATGRPVITTCSTPEVASEYGDVTFLLEREDPIGLGRLIDHVAGLTAEERWAMGERGRLRVAESKTWSRQASRVAAFMERRGASPGIR